MSALDYLKGELAALERDGLLLHPRTLEGPQGARARYEGRGVMINASQRGGRVRRDDLNEAFWTERFMFAQRIDGVATTRPASLPETRPSRGDRARTAARVLGQIAEILLRRR